ncbi:rod shape-determining protein MreD [Lachnotalea glycerini]|uniref:Rod shape-determining protein MreD n=1 Tax=Lachnotalea glycerini TaxID=1763509 RepID=A0A255I6S9_9FIRM|nr:rod shape-determining protein MreD [Lachnotalea glycerini]PXV95529.1 rod shape-determining protein MreD [Lachnotalea glycerini]RDY32847.1 rod shape-determining protein MreD [Lachnotalea glycerini]
MNRKIVVTLLVIVCFCFQCTLFKALSMAYITPNLLIVVTSSFGFMRGKKEGLIIGFFCGFLIDIFYGDVLGFYALIYMYIGYVNGFFNKLFYDEDIKLPIVLITISDLIYGLIIYVFLFLLRSRFDFGYYFVHIILPEVVYTVVVTIVLYRIIRAINRKLESHEKRSASKFV